MIEIINVSTRGQIVIPQKMRRYLNIKKGTRLALVEKNGELIIKKEQDIEKNMNEDLGWKILAQQSLEEIWKNDTHNWNKYLNEENL